MQPAPAIPPFEPPPLSAPMGDSGRRILWIVGLYRAICAAMLLGAALLLDPKTINIAQPNAFVTGTGLYFVFGLSTFWWVQQDRLPCRCRRCCSACSRATSSSCRSSCIAGGTFGAPLPILLFPQLAAAGWILRTQTAFFHAAFAAVALLGLDAYRAWLGTVSGAAGVPDRHHRLRLLRDRRHRRRAGPLHEAVGGPRRAARHRRRQPRAGQPADHPGHAGRRARRRPERRRARPQRAGHAAAGRLRADARRHAARRVLDDAARLLAPLAGGLHRGAAAVQGRGDPAAAARAPRPDRHGPERRHAHLSRRPRPRADRGAADEAGRDGAAHRVDRARGAQSAVGDQPGRAAARGGRRRRAGGRAPARDDPQQREADRPHRRRSAAAEPARPPAAGDRAVRATSCAR